MYREDADLNGSAVELGKGPVTGSNYMHAWRRHRMSRETCDILNRIGMILGFLSFWFAAPEFIGEERLKQWEIQLAAWLTGIPGILKKIAIGILLIYAAYTVAAWNPILLGLTKRAPIPWWLTLLSGAPLFFIYLQEVIIMRVVPTLANNTRTRQNSLIVAGIFFTSSFVLQFISTFQVTASK
jgi:hypothetical protein